MFFNVREFEMRNLKDIFRGRVIFKIKPVISEDSKLIFRLKIKYSFSIAKNTYKLLLSFT